MKRIYAESTLNKKYREIGLTKNVVWKLRVYLKACAYFYRFAEADEVWRAILKTENTQAEKDVLSKLTKDIVRTADALLAYEDEIGCDVQSKTDRFRLVKIASKLIQPMSPMPTRDQFDAFLRAEEHADREYVVFENSDIYIDGKDGPCMIAFPDVLFNVAKSEDGEESLEINYDRLWELQKKRIGKTQYIPDDLLCYATLDYVPETEQSRALLEWIVQIGVSDEDAEEVLCELHEIVCDAETLGKEKQAMEVLNQRGVVFNRAEDAYEFIKRFTDFNNHTRLPIHKGQIPSEMMKDRKTLPSGIEFGPGLQEAIRRGDIDGAALKAGIMAKSELPSGIKMSLASEVDRALAPNEERWIGTTLIKGKKIGPNDPCPCGSGKKYKKCCGRN